LLPNLADCDYFTPVEPSGEKFSEDHPFVITYAGAIGYANQVDHVIDVAAKCLENDLPVQFHIAGEGAQKDQILSRASDMPNVVMYDSGGKENVRKLMDISHAAIISYRNENILSTGCPNKYMDALAAGKLVIINFRGWIKSEIETAECGFSYPADNPGSFHAVIKSFLDSPMMLAHFQQNARILAEERYDVPVFQVNLLRIINGHQPKNSKSSLTSTALG
ncbi:MAG: glycosyltransferase, partial [Saprospiraceae bacterium]|nr:glycosyltransferase [Saprospiraceae bacterium]